MRRQGCFRKFQMTGIIVSEFRFARELHFSNGRTEPKGAMERVCWARSGCAEATAAVDRADRAPGPRELALERDLEAELEGLPDTARELRDLELGLDRELGAKKDAKQLITWSKECTGACGEPLVKGYTWLSQIRITYFSACMFRILSKPLEASRTLHRFTY